MRDLLITHGGTAVRMPAVEDAAADLLRRGDFFPGTEQAERTQGRKRLAVHQAAAACYLRNPVNFVLFTGYALDLESGQWREWSWCYKRSYRKGIVARLVECARPMAAYFGYRLTPTEAREFCRDND